MFHFKTPWKHQKTFGFITYSRVWKKKIGLKRQVLSIPGTLTEFFLKVFSTISQNSLENNCYAVSDTKNWKSKTGIFCEFHKIINPLLPGVHLNTTYLNKPAAFSCKFV